MTTTEQLIDHIRETIVPDKARILRMRALARELACDVHDRAAAKLLVQRLNGAYLVLQLATLSDDSQAMEFYRRECLSLVRAIDKGRGAPNDRPPETEAQSPVLAKR